MREPYIFSVWLHIIAACYWLGGMLFFAAVVLPISRRLLGEQKRAQIISEAGYAFRRTGWAALIILLATGFYNLSYRHYNFSNVFAESGTGFDRMLIAKLLLFLVVIAMSAVHDFWLGPAAANKWQEQPGEQETLRLRRMAGWFGRFNLVLGLVMVWLGIRLVRG